MATSTGADWFDKISDLYLTKRSIDLETKREDKNVPDRVDAAAKPAVPGVPSWVWVAGGLGIGAIVLIAVLKN